MHLSSILRVFSFLALAVFLASAGAYGQNKSRMTSKAPVFATKAKVDEPLDPEKFRRDYIKAAEEYRASLHQLAESYEGSLKKATDQHDKLKELFVDGIISRREYEASEASITEARGKIEGVRAEIATTESTIDAAKKPAPAATVDTSIRADVAWSTGKPKIDALIRYYGMRSGVDPYLIYCVMHQESRFGAGAVSTAGAQGLMQLMPGTAARYGVTNPFDPAQSIMGGTRYMKDLLRLFNGRVDLALAGYNAGEGAVMKYGRRVPPYRETQNYVRIIGSRYSKGIKPKCQPSAVSC